MRTTAEAQEPTYTLGDSPDEQARLLRQAEQFRTLSAALLERVGVQPGWRAVDMGCGPMGILDLLSAKVGPTGSVVGVDLQPEMIKSAQKWVQDQQRRNIDLVTASAHSCLLPDNSVDLAHARLLLINVANPPDVVREMVRIVRPGGWVALHEMDWSSWTCVPSSPSWNRMRSALAKVWSGDVFMGHRLPGLLRAAGAVDVKLVPTTQTTTPTDPAHRLFLYFARRARSRLLSERLLSEQEYDDILQELTERLEHSDSLVVRELTCQAWGRVPTTPDRSH